MRLRKCDPCFVSNLPTFFFQRPQKRFKSLQCEIFYLNKASINVQCRNKYSFFDDEANEEIYCAVSAFNNQYYNSKVYYNNCMWVGVKVFGLCFKYDTLSYEILYFVSLSQCRFLLLYTSVFFDYSYNHI